MKQNAEQIAYTVVKAVAQLLAAEPPGTTVRGETIIELADAILSKQFPKLSEEEMSEVKDLIVKQLVETGAEVSRRSITGVN